MRIETDTSMKSLHKEHVSSVNLSGLGFAEGTHRLVAGEVEDEADLGERQGVSPPLRACIAASYVRP